MRIIAGIHRGRRLSVLEGQSVRPTTDRMRERVFSMLQHARYPNMNGARIADIFAGTGALGLESLSRGAHDVTFVEKSAKNLKVLKTNITLLKETTASKVLNLDATRLPKTDEPYDIIFMDPPYRRGLIARTLKAVLAANWLAPHGVIIAEMAHDEDFSHPSTLEIIDTRIQGQQKIVFIQFAP